MNKKLKRILLVVTLTILLITTLTGCIMQDYSSDAQVFMKWDTKKIVLYADKNCHVEATIDIEDEEDSTFKKTIYISKGKTSQIYIDDIATDFFSEQAKIKKVEVSEPMQSNLAWWVYLIIAIVILWILSR